MTRPRTRRAFLRLSGATAASTSIAGCSAFGDEGSGLVLGSISVRNAHRRVHSVRVELERRGEPVREVTVEVDGDGGVEVIAATWPSTPAVYTLRYVVLGPSEDPDIRTRTLTAEDAQSDGRDCTVAAITIGFPDEGRPYVSVGAPESLGGNCSDGSP